MVKDIERERGIGRKRRRYSRRWWGKKDEGYRGRKGGEGETRLERKSGEREKIVME